MTWESGTIMWHRHRRQNATFIAVDDLDASTAHVEFPFGDAARVSLDQLEPVFSPAEAQAWTDRFQHLVDTGHREIPWGRHTPSGEHKAAISYLAHRLGLLTVWTSPSGSADFILACHDVPAEDGQQS